MQIVETVRQWWRVQSYLRKLEALGPVARAELARDNAIPETDLRQLVSRRETDSALLPRLLKRLGIDPEQLARRQASLMRDMTIVCARCAMTRRCRSDLSQQDAPLRHARYCPNTETIRALRQGYETGARPREF